MSKKPISSASKLSQEQVHELISLYHDGQFEIALSKIKPLKDSFPESVVLLNIEGALNASLQRYQAAIDSYKLAIKIKPDYDEAYNNMGNALKGKGDIEGAIHSYKKAIHINSDYAEAYHNLALAQNEIGAFKQAHKNSKRFIELKPNSAEAYYLLGNSLNGQNLEKAIENCIQALKIKPGYVQAHDEISYCLRNYFFSLNNESLSNIQSIDNLIELERQTLRRKISEHSFWFVDIPKTSSTAINVLLGSKFGSPFGKNNYFDNNGLQVAQINRSLLLPDHTPAFIAKHYIGDDLWERIDRFTVVRNPYSWCSSLWHHTLKHHYLGIRANTFEQFLDFLEEKVAGDFTRRMIYPTNYRQTDYILDIKGKKLVNQLFRLEDRNAIHEYLKSKGISGYLGTQLMRFGNETKSSDYEIKSFEKKKIEHIFQRDFEILGY